MTAQNCCNILPGRFLCSMQFLRTLGSISSLEGHSVLPRLRGPHPLCLMAQLLNFSVDERLMEVGQVPAQHKLVPGLAFNEVWIHASDVMLAAAKSRPRDDELHPCLLKTFAIMLIAAQDLAVLHQKYSPNSAVRQRTPKSISRRSSSRHHHRHAPCAATAEEGLASTTLVPAMKEKMTVGAVPRLVGLSPPGDRGHKTCKAVDVDAVLPWEDLRPQCVWKRWLFQLVGHCALTFPFAVQVFYATLAFFRHVPDLPSAISSESRLGGCRRTALVRLGFWR